jgi:Flp pilus assembly protein TadG
MLVFRIAWQIRRAVHSPVSHCSAEEGPQSAARQGVTGNFLSRFLRDRDGAIAAISAVSLVVILGMGAFAIDMSYAYSERNLLQVTASAAALAAAPQLPDLSGTTDKAVEYAEENMPPETHGMVLDNSDVVLGNWDSVSETWTPGGSPSNAVEITTRRSTVNGNRLELFLAPILGLGSLDMEASAVAYARTPTAWDVALVQDVTGTFAEEIGDAREADQAMLDCISNNFVDARMGLTAFTGTSHIMTPMLPVGLPENFFNYVELSDAIDQLDSCGHIGMPPCTGTHVGIGIERGIDQLDSYVPSPGVIGQAIVIVGDGRPNARNNAQGFYPESDYYGVCGGNCSDGELAQMAILAADEADSKDYDVFVVFYDEENDDDAAEFFEGLVRGAGQFRRTPNSDELEEMMFELCTGFMDLQLVM